MYEQMQGFSEMPSVWMFHHDINFSLVLKNDWIVMDCIYIAFTDTIGHQSTLHFASHLTIQSLIQTPTAVSAMKSAVQLIGG